MKNFELKTLPQFLTKTIEGRTVTGIAAVFGNVDLGQDRIWPGAFAKTLAEGRGRFKHLWNHGQEGWEYFCTPPIAAIRELREVSRAELPAAVLAYAPEASGGLQVKREYLDTPRGNEILQALDQGAGLEMSFGYDPIKWDYETINSGQPTEYCVRNLREVRLWDTSDVNWGMNPATTAGGKAQDLRAALFARVESAVQEFRSGKREFAEHLLKLRTLLAELEFGEQQSTQPEPQGSRAESFDWRTSLTQNLSLLHELELTL